MIKNILLSINGLLFSLTVLAQGVSNTDVEEIKWKTESQVRALLGEPNSIHGPVGTHASYTLWKYADSYVAFSNNRAFHRFSQDSLRKIELIDAK